VPSDRGADEPRTQPQPPRQTRTGSWQQLVTAHFTQHLRKRGSPFRQLPKRRPRDEMNPPPRPNHSPATAARPQHVNATISRDSAGGNLARETAALQALVSKSTTANKGSTVHPSSDPVGLALSPSEAKRQSKALQDYHMQLMRLEQQNKKRLMPRDPSPPILERGELQRPDMQINPLEPSLTSDEQIPKTGTAWRPDMEQHPSELKRRRDDDRATAPDESAKRMKQIETSASTQGFLVSGLRPTLRHYLCQLSRKFIDIYLLGGELDLNCSAKSPTSAAVDIQNPTRRREPACCRCTVLYPAPGHLQLTLPHEQRKDIHKSSYLDVGHEQKHI